MMSALKQQNTIIACLVGRLPQLELAAPGDMVYLKHSPAMRCYVVLRGTVLLTNNVLDREGVEVRTILLAGTTRHRHPRHATRLCS